MIDPICEREQFKLLKGGSPKAYAFFFVKHNSSIYNYFRVLGADAELAKDLCQDIFKRLWDLRDKLNSAQHLAAYLVVMARHRYLYELRRDKISSNVKRELAYRLTEDEGRDMELEIICKQVLAQIESAMQALSPKRKKVLRLLYIEELDVEAIAGQLGLSPQTIRNTKAQAVNFLRERLYDRDLVLPGILPLFMRYLEEQ